MAHSAIPSGSINCFACIWANGWAAWWLGWPVPVTCDDCSVAGCWVCCDAYQEIPFSFYTHKITFFFVYIKTTIYLLHATISLWYLEQRQLCFFNSTCCNNPWKEFRSQKKLMQQNDFLYNNFPSNNWIYPKIVASCIIDLNLGKICKLIDANILYMNSNSPEDVLSVVVVAIAVWSL